MTQTPARPWRGADAYEAYMGRWSRPMARAYLDWLNPPPGLRWLDVGCGTGAVAAAVLEAAAPSEILGVDPSSDFVAMARDQVPDSRARFEVGDARNLRVETGSFDVVAAGLVINHVAEPALAVAEMSRAARLGGRVSGYVWDYTGEMQLIRLFWEAVDATGGAELSRDLRPHYEIAKPEPLRALFRTAGLTDVAVEAIDLPLHFPDFADYWMPHILTGPAPVQRYAALLDDNQKAALREQLRAMAPIAADGTIDLIGRAWAVRATKP
jgi:SAM-dependent methyltransferase